MWSRGLALVMMIGCAGCLVRHDAAVTAIASRDGDRAFAYVTRWRVERDPEWGWHEIDKDCENENSDDGGKGLCEMGNAFANLLALPFALLLLPVPEHIHHVPTGHTSQLVEIDLRTGVQRVRARDLDSGDLLGYDAGRDVVWIRDGDRLVSVAGDGTRSPRAARGNHLPGGLRWDLDDVGVRVWSPWSGRDLALDRRWRPEAWREGASSLDTPGSVAQCATQRGTDGTTLTILRLRVAALAHAERDPTVASERPWPVAFTACRVTPDGLHVAGSRTPGVVELWQVDPPTRLRVIEAREWRWHDDHALAIGGVASRVVVDVATGVERELPFPALPSRPERRPGWTTLTPTRNGRFLAVRYPDGVPEFAVFDATTTPPTPIAAP